MRIAIILLSLAVVLGSYLVVTFRERNFVNVLLPFVLLNVPAYYVFELVFQLVLEPQGSVYAYGFCYTAYALGALAKALGYLAFPAVNLPLLFRVPRLRIPFAPFIFLGLGVLLYLPVLVEYSDLIFSPREIYTKTRTGYGIYFYLSTFFIYFAFILLLFSGPVRRSWMALFGLVSLVALYLHGSKAQILAFFLIALYFVAFVRGRRFSFKRIVGIGAASAIFVMVLFYLTLPATMRGALILGVASYSDYTRHAAEVIDDEQLQPQFGRLALEGAVYSFIPRALFPDKPKDFGPLWLAKRYYPDWFESDTGAPAFGIGVEYADFGPFSMIWIIMNNLIAGMLLKVLVTRSRLRPDAGTFVLLLLFLQMELVPTGSGAPFFFYYVVALAANTFGARPLPAAAAPPAKLSVSQAPAVAGAAT